MNAPLKIGIAGLGTVGSSVARRITDYAQSFEQSCGRKIQISAISARDKARDRGFDLANIEWFNDPVELAKNADIDVFVELMGGSGASSSAYLSVKAALDAGRHVVTANKALLASYGVELAQLAESKGLILNFEAAVAGGIPIIKTMRESLSGNSVARVFGILNGTCNYILTRMEREGISFDECLKDAQNLGYAEADPTFDIDGYDTAHKLSLLTSLAFGTEIAVDQIYVEGIRNIELQDIYAAKELGYRIKLFGVAQKTASGIEQRVHPTMVPLSSVIAQVHGVTNAVSVHTDMLGELLMSGPGAGGDATASSVVGDIVDIAKARSGVQTAPVFGTPAHALKPYTQAQMTAHCGGYFIRLNVHDRVGVFAAIAKIMADNLISLESIVQRNAANNSENVKTVILITHETTESAVRDALKTIEKEGYLVNAPQMIRIERAG